MRRHTEPLDAGSELADGGVRYRVMRVEQPPNERSFGHAWVERIDGM
jgi:hypothetical protein